MRINAPKGALSGVLREQIVRSKQEILAHLRRSTGGMPRCSRIPRLADDRPVALSFAQERLWFLQQLRLDSSVYNLCRALRITGPLDLPALESSCNELVRRHESLRTKFVAADGRPRQVAAPAFHLALAPIDLRTLPEATRGGEAMRVIAEQARQPFDLTDGRLLRVCALRLRADEHIFALIAHHIAADAWSMGILVRELWAIYEACLSGKAFQPAEIPCRYRDYAAWQRRRFDRLRQADVDYWKEKLAGLAAVDLPTDRPPPARPSFHGGKVAIELPDALTNPLNRLSRREGATVFMTLLAAFQVLLRRWSGQDDIAVGAPVANRESSELEGIIGLFVDVVVLRTDLAGAPRFRELLRRAREACLEAYAHQPVPFEFLVREINPARRLERHPVIQVMLVLQNTPSAPAAPAGLIVEPLEIECETAQFDLSLYLRERAGRLIGHFEYATDIFDRATIERMAGHFTRLLESIVADPDCSIASLPMLSPREERRLLTEWNDTAARYPKEATIHRLFEAQCERTPNAAALEFQDGRITYSELNARANRLARDLQELGIGPERRVGLLAEQSLETMIGILAILKAGAAYVPLDPDYPQERLVFMVEDAKAEVLLAQKKFAGNLPGYSGKVVLLDDLLRRSQGRAANLPTSAHDEGAACIIYTSGSTGNPKGVVAPHRGAINRFVWMWKTYPFGADEKSCQKTSLSFVDSVWEIFGALLQGVPTVLVPNAIANDPVWFVEQLAKSGVTRLVLVPSLLKEILERCTDLSSRLARLDYCFSSGEVLFSDLAARFHKALPACRLINLYGSSEVAGDATFYEVSGSHSHSTVPIGRPIDNTQVYLLDEDQQLVPVGARGELYIGGDNLVRGYLRRPELTAEKFVVNPFSADANSRLYRTGDLARYRPDGNIEFLGRKDHQVKIRGIRVELGEIEAALRRHPGVRDAVVILRRDDAIEANCDQTASSSLSGAGAGRLAAYIVAQRRVPSRADVRSYLREKLPAHMLPSTFVFLEAMPRLPNGKVDRRALPPPDETSRHSSGSADSRTEIEALVAEAWREVLKIQEVDVVDNFFDLGGHSLLAAELAVKLGHAFGRAVSLRDVFDAPTVADLARKIESTSGGEPLPPLRALGGRRPMPLSLSQEPLFLFSQLFGGGDFLNLPYAYRLGGKLDVPALGRTINEIVRRHAVLRSGFSETADGPKQFLRRGAGVKLKVFDLSRLPQRSREKKFAEVSKHDAAQVFDVEKPPLMRVKLLRLERTEHVLLVTMHHIVSDQWSMGVFRRELALIYQAFSTGKSSPLPDLALQFADFASWQRDVLQQGRFNSQVSYWQRQLGAPSPSLEFRACGRRKKPPRYHSARRELDFDDALFCRIKAFARKRNCTPFMVFAAALSILLHRHTRSIDIRIGTPVANRGQAGSEDLIGYFVNVLVLRASVEPHMTFFEILDQVRETCVAAYMHQDVPFEYLENVLNNEGRKRQTPLYQVMLNYRNQSSPALEANDLTIASWNGKQRAGDPGIAMSRLDVNVQLREMSTKLTGAVNYKTDLFDDAAMTEFIAGYISILDRMVLKGRARIADAGIG